MSKIVITYGTFDLFHYGHYNLLESASRLGDYLIVGVSSDNMCRSKGKIPVLPLARRMEMVKNLRFVDKVIVEENMAQKVHDVQKFSADVFCLGSDYETIFPLMAEYKQLVDYGCRIVFIERTKGISTSILKELKE